MLAMNKHRILRCLTALYGLGLVVLIVAAAYGRVPMWWAYQILSWADKLAHFVLIGGFALLLNLALEARTYRWGRLSFLVGSVWITVAVLIEEASQLFLETRAFEFTDLGADLLGIVFFGQLARLWVYLQRRRERRRAEDAGRHPVGVLP